MGCVNGFLTFLLKISIDFNKNGHKFGVFVGMMDNMRVRLRLGDIKVLPSQKTAPPTVQSVQPLRCSSSNDGIFRRIISTQPP
jgi:hypothetical protein